MIKEILRRFAVAPGLMADASAMAEVTKTMDQLTEALNSTQDALRVANQEIARLQRYCQELP